jgi:hypothetical protein
MVKGIDNLGTQSFFRETKYLFIDNKLGLIIHVFYFIPYIIYLYIELLRPNLDLHNIKYLPLFHHFKAIYQFPKHITFLV